MRDASETPKPFKKYSVGNAELKTALGIDWPGPILSIYESLNGFTVTMHRRPDELTGADRERLTMDTTVRIPLKTPLVSGSVPNVPVKKWWQRSG
jgi:hypothetical protein